MSKKRKSEVSYNVYVNSREDFDRHVDFGNFRSHTERELLSALIPRVRGGDLEVRLFQFDMPDENSGHQFNALKREYERRHLRPASPREVTALAKNSNFSNSEPTKEVYTYLRSPEGRWIYLILESSSLKGFFEYAWSGPAFYRKEPNRWFAGIAK